MSDIVDAEVKEEEVIPEEPKVPLIPVDWIVQIGNNVYKVSATNYRDIHDKKQDIPKSRVFFDNDEAIIIAPRNEIKFMGRADYVEVIKH